MLPIPAMNLDDNLYKFEEEVSTSYAGRTLLPRGGVSDLRFRMIREFRQRSLKAWESRKLWNCIMFRHC